LGAVAGPSGDNQEQVQGCHTVRQGRAPRYVALPDSGFRRVFKDIGSEDPVFKPYVNHRTPYTYTLKGGVRVYGRGSRTVYGQVTDGVRVYDPSPQASPSGPASNPMSGDSATADQQEATVPLGSSAVAVSGVPRGLRYFKRHFPETPHEHLHEGV